MNVLAQSMRALPPSGLPGWGSALVYAGAAAVFVIGARFVWSGRRGESQAQAKTFVGRWHAATSLPSRAAVGLTLMLLAYHGAAWVSPWQDRLLIVPVERWYIVGAAAALVVGSTLLIDWMDSRAGPRSPGET